MIKTITSDSVRNVIIEANKLDISKKDIISIIVKDSQVYLIYEHNK